MVKRKTQATRLVRKLKALREDMLRRMHTPVREQHRWLCQVLRGHYQYYGVIFNYQLTTRVQGLRRQALAQDTRQAQPEGPRDLGVLSAGS